VHDILNNNKSKAFLSGISTDNLFQFNSLSKYGKRIQLVSNLRVFDWSQYRQTVDES